MWCGGRGRIVRAAGAIGLYAGAFGASFGAVSVGSGLSVGHTMVLSLVLFSGASQFAFAGVGGVLAGDLIMKANVDLFLALAAAGAWTCPCARIGGQAAAAASSRRLRRGPTRAGRVRAGLTSAGLDLSADDVDKWLAAKAKSYSTRTLQALHSCLNRSIRRAMARDKVKRNVVELCSVPRGTAGRPSKSTIPTGRGSVSRSGAGRSSRTTAPAGALSPSTKWTTRRPVRCSATPLA